MTKRLELTGQRFSELFVESFAGVRNERTLWNCRCACGKTKVVVGHDLITGNTTSCGGCVLRKVEIIDSYVKIPLTQNQFTIVDLVDYNSIAELHANWWASWCKDTRSFYAYRKLNGTMVSMQRIIMNPPAGMVVDHINHDTLDNRRCNLRLCTPSQNNRNQLMQRRKKSSKYKGVFWRKDISKWAASIGFKGKKYHLGLYDTELEAALAYNAAAPKLHGAFCKLNDLRNFPTT